MRWPKSDGGTFDNSWLWPKSPLSKKNGALVTRMFFLSSACVQIYIYIYIYCKVQR